MGYRGACPERGRRTQPILQVFSSDRRMGGGAAPIPIISLRIRPARTVTLDFATRGTSLARFDASGEHRLDQTPSRREIGVVGRQCPDAMEMVWQHDDGVDCERASRSDIAKRRSKQMDSLGQ